MMRSKESRFGGSVRSVVGIGLVLALVNLFCGGGGGGGDGGAAALSSFSVPAGSTKTYDYGAAINVTGNATIDGTLDIEGGLLLLKVNGDLSVNGTIEAIHASPPAAIDTSVAAEQQPTGICILVGGSITFGPNAMVTSNGPIVITDDAAELTRPLQSFVDDANSASGTLPTFVPLPPDDPVFKPALTARAAPLSERQLPVETVSGVWDGSGLPGDVPVVVFRFNGARDLVIDDWTVRGPNGVQGSANSPNGRNGMSLLIWNNTGKITFTGTTTLSVPNGGDGVSKTQACGTAIGGNGGKPGNLRVTAAGGIEIEGTLTINLGRGGHGGAATVTGTDGAAGCPGEKGCDSTATGGNGGDNLKRFYARGNVAGVTNIVIGPMAGGNGGTATATAGNGGPGDDCCDGGAGGTATATGGNGGNASLNVSGLAVTTGAVTGGDGGNATATGGNGGPGGDCKFPPAGAGGALGAATATAGTPGTGSTAAGAAGTATATPGVVGANGNLLGILSWHWLRFGFLIPDGTPFTTPGGEHGDLTAGSTSTGPLFDSTNTNEVGTMPVTFGSAGQYFWSRFSDADVIAVNSGTVTLNVSQVTGVTGPWVGLQLDTYNANGIDASNPLVVDGLDAAGNVVGTSRTFPTIPDNSMNPTQPQLLEHHFEASVAAIRITVPQLATCRFLRICILDP